MAPRIGCVWGHELACSLSWRNGYEETLCLELERNQADMFRVSPCTRTGPSSFIATRQSRGTKSTLGTTRQMTTKPWQRQRSGNTKHPKRHTSPRRWAKAVLVPPPHVPVCCLPESQSGYRQSSWKVRQRQSAVGIPMEAAVGELACRAAPCEASQRDHLWA